MAHEAGKGPGRRAGADDAAYREGHDRIDWGAKGKPSSQEQVPLTTKHCETCEGHGYVETGMGSVELCMRCDGTGEAL